MMIMSSGTGRKSGRGGCWKIWGIYEEDAMDDAVKASVMACHDVVNMSAMQWETWRSTDESQDVGHKDGGGKAIGHKMGHTSIELLGKRRSNGTDDDIHKMGRVVSYVHRHMAQRQTATSRTRTGTLR
jgi:hypothetical protein